MALLEEATTVNVQPADKSKIGKLWKIAGILLIVTLIEFAFAFGLPESFKWTKISIFVGLTFVKAFYIVLNNRHLLRQRIF